VTQAAEVPSDMETSPNALRRPHAASRALATARGPSGWGQLWFCLVAGTVRLSGVAGTCHGLLLSCCSQDSSWRHVLHSRQHGREMLARLDSPAAPVGNPMGTAGGNPQTCEQPATVNSASYRICGMIRLGGSRGQEIAGNSRAGQDTAKAAQTPQPYRPSLCPTSLREGGSNVPVGSVGRADQVKRRGN